MCLGVKVTKVLLIGQSFLYDLVDDKVLKKNNICPIYALKKDDCDLAKENTVRYNELSVDAFRPIVERIQPAAITCFNDNFLVQAACLRDEFGISGMGKDDILKFKIKSQMYQALEGAIPVPKTLKIDTSIQLQTVVEMLGRGEYFIKPDNLAGSEGTSHITSLESLEELFKHAAIKSGQYLIQKYYQLPLVHCELYIQQGEVRYCQARRYSYPNHMFLEGKIIASFPIEDVILCNKIELYAKKIATILNYKNGVMHTEFFVDNDGSLIFLETNIRQAGGSVNLIHKKRSGLGMETAMVLLELGLPLELNEDYSGYEISGYIPMQGGRVINVKLPQLKGQFDFDIRVTRGDICYPPSSVSQASISFLARSERLEDLLEDFNWLENNSMIEYQSVN